MTRKFQILINILISVIVIGCELGNEDVWLMDCEINNEQSCGFKNTNGEIEINFGKYQMIFTDTFRNYAIVLKENEGFIGIDRNESTLFKIYTYDNGPDYMVEGLFRIKENGKIGFVNHKTGQIVIKPKFSAAQPFENGYSAFCKDCETIKDGEHSKWENGEWGLIDRKGVVVVKPIYDRIKSIGKNNQIVVIEDGNEKEIKM